METERENGATEAHMNAAGKIDRVERSVRRALDDLHEVSREMKDRIAGEKNPSHKSDAPVEDSTDRLKDDKNPPADSELENAVEPVKAIDGDEENRNPAELHADGPLR
jgi:hypothetical protein